MTEEELKAVWASMPAEQAEEYSRTAERIGAALRALRDECRADQAKGSELNEPWVLVDRLAIPRDNVPESAEERLRQSFQLAVGSNAQCSFCETVVLGILLALVIATLFLTALLAAQLAPPVATGLIAAGFVLLSSATVAISAAMSGQFAEAVGGPVCSGLGYC